MRRGGEEYIYKKRADNLTRDAKEFKSKTGTAQVY